MQIFTSSIFNRLKSKVLRQRFIGSKSMQHDELVYSKRIHQVEQPEAVQIASQRLLAGDIIALPTDTVYGIACNANNIKAVQKLYDIKGRNCLKPVAICVKNIDDLRRYGNADHLSDALLEHLLPGPITIVVERSPNLSNPLLNPGTSKIGIRIPNFPFIQQLCTLCAQPLALTSANRSAERSTLEIHEFEMLWPLLGAVFDAGSIGCTEQQRSASTVIDLAMPGYYKVLRPGIALKTTLEALHSYGLKLCNDC